jgi:hypothetical protein
VFTDPISAPCFLFSFCVAWCWLHFSISCLILCTGFYGKRPFFLFFLAVGWLHPYKPWEQQAEADAGLLLPYSTPGGSSKWLAGGILLFFNHQEIGATL